MTFEGRFGFHVALGDVVRRPFSLLSLGGCFRPSGQSQCQDKTQRALIVRIGFGSYTGFYKEFTIAGLGFRINHTIAWASLSAQLRPPAPTKAKGWQGGFRL